VHRLVPDPERPREGRPVGASDGWPVLGEAPRPKAYQRGCAEAGAGNEEIEMVAILTLLAVTVIFAVELTRLVRC
jgi:hypothetical protein